MKSVAQISRWWETIQTIKEQFSLSLIFSISALPVTLLLGVAIGVFNPVYGIVTAGCLFFAIIVLLRLDEVTVTLIIAVHLYVDFYIGLHLVAIIMALVLLSVCYFGRSPDHPWVEVRPAWLWMLFLVLTIYPAIRGRAVLYDLASYYPSDIFGALLMFWLGSIIAKDISALRRAFQLLSALAALLAIHTIIQTTTGNVLFGSTRANELLAQVSNYHIEGTGAFRSGSFFIDPNWNGTFFATMFFLPFGLFIESRRLLAKMVFLAEMLMILSALLFTYSNGAWIAVLGGVFFFMVFVGNTHSRILLLVLVAALAAIGLLFFSSQIAVQLLRAANPQDLLLRQAVWETAIGVIEAYPLFGVGLGGPAYLNGADPYRVPAQYEPLSHPHNSYLQWGAMAGIPVLVVFLLLLGYAFWCAWRNWRAIDPRYRPLLGGGISALIALSINSWSIDGWTNAVMATVGWLIAGAIVSPLIEFRLRKRTEPSVDEKAKNNVLESQSA